MSSWRTSDTTTVKSRDDDPPKRTEPSTAGFAALLPTSTIPLRALIMDCSMSAPRPDESDRID